MIRVNKSSAVDVAKGTPIVFEVFLTATHTGRTFTIGSRLRPWHRLLHLEMADTGRTPPWRAAAYGEAALHALRSPARRERRACRGIGARPRAWMG